MRVALIGNINNNSYLIAKFLRRKGVEADVFIYDYDYWMAAPEWEEGVFDIKIVPSLYPKWSWVPLNNNWIRPSWVKTVPPLTWHRLPYAKADPFIEQMEWRLNEVLKRRQHRIVNESLRRRGLPELDFAQACQYFDIYRWEKIIAGYDIVQVCGLDAIHCLLEYPRKTYIVYDIGGPLRSQVWKDSPLDTLLRAAYKNADGVIITNPDTRESAERLGIKNYTFIPSPVDEAKFCPGESRLRKELEAKYGQNIVVLFAPGRHDWEVKGTDKILKAFTRLKKQAQVKVILIAVEWAKDALKAREFAEKENLGSDILWIRPLNRTALVDYYRAADVVLDQFVLGTYGKAAREAMACAKPVIGYFVPELHKWCHSEMPPFCSAQDEEGIYMWLINLVHDPQLRQEYGQRSRRWIEKYNGWEQVASSYINLYTLLWDQRRASRGRL
ncbi:MAG: glycosyltransferase family 4 protein [Candidatus Methanomethylicaceae archaeon]